MPRLRLQYVNRYHYLAALEHLEIKQNVILTNVTGSHYDISGRARKGPAPTNLEVSDATGV